jgi:hypothetical protein
MLNNAVTQCLQNGIVGILPRKYQSESGFVGLKDKQDYE